MKKPPTTSKDIPHVVLRIGSYNERNIGENVIELHNQVAKELGSVFLGKAGRGFSEQNAQRLERALSSGQECKLILVTRKGSHVEGYGAYLKRVLPTGERPDKCRVPKYYQDLLDEIDLWFEIGELNPLVLEVMTKLELFSNQRPLIETILTCRTSLMIVKERTS